MNYLAKKSKPVVLSEISKACKLPLATTHRLLA
ncbi:MAG: helix-turn-helix domain-containing protein, partial [Clostridiaceae bacterium]|nr:helix-turn-helix domain-containing protein [Clostridiaceae bacterium]